MSRIVNSPEVLASVDRLAQRDEDARRFAADQIKAKAWAPLSGVASVGIMELVGCMCRWPVSDPEHKGAFRYCGSPCPPEASYCKRHRAMAVSPSSPRRF